MINSHLEITLKGEIFLLLPQKAMYRPAKQQLILSDLHLGKAAHFRKNGIPLPTPTKSTDLENLQELINHLQPKKIILLGDLFHSDYNTEWLLFQQFLNHNNLLSFVLVKGNHDVLKKEVYNIQNLVVVDKIDEPDFIFTHHPIKKSTRINFCGHIHPALKVTGKAKQSITFPCFYFGANNFIFPAFGSLTGLCVLKPEKDATYYLVSLNRVVEYAVL